MPKSPKIEALTFYDKNGHPYHPRVAEIEQLRRTIKVQKKANDSLRDKLRVSQEEAASLAHRLNECRQARTRLVHKHRRQRRELAQVKSRKEELEEAVDEFMLKGGDDARERE